MTNLFSAGSSALGYLFQIRYALYLILSETNLDKDIRIESLDDVSFEKNGTPIELIQLKHHINKSATLTNGCSDLWKTIRVWSETLFHQGNLFNEQILLTLVTTGVAPENAATNFMKNDANRDSEKALDLLLEFAEISTNDANKKSYEIFKKLSREDQLKLIKSIIIIDQSPNIFDISAQIKLKLAFATRRKTLNALYERVEGWWLSKTIEHLLGNSQSSISGFEVQDIVHDYAEQLHPESLPIDYYELYPDWESEILKGDVLFIEQLKLLELNKKSIDFAARDYYRAFIQRSRWIKDELLYISELEKYEDKLFDEWDRNFTKATRFISSSSDEKTLIEKGIEILDWMNDSKNYIRSDCTESYVVRGSYHILANNALLTLGWHPNFKERLAQNETYQEKSS